VSERRQPPRLAPRDHVWLARRTFEDFEDIEDAEFIDRPDRPRTVIHEIVRESATPPPTSSAWIPVAIGLGVIALVSVAGVVIYMLLRRRDTALGGVDLPALPAAPQPSVFLINTTTGDVRTAAPPTAPVVDRRDDRRDEAILAALQKLGTNVDVLARHTREPFAQSSLRTYRLPWLADASTPAVRVATAGDVSAEVWVRVVAPPGALAAFSFTPSELDAPQAIIAPGLSRVPAGETLVVPSGQAQMIRMNPRQVLYAKGNMSPTSPTGPVIVSIASVDNSVGR
jgi:hypothetical protein